MVRTLDDLEQIPIACYMTEPGPHPCSERAPSSKSSAYARVLVARMRSGKPSPKWGDSMPHVRAFVGF